MWMSWLSPLSHISPPNFPCTIPTGAINIVNGCMNSPSKWELSGKVVCHVKRNGWAVSSVPTPLHETRESYRYSLWVFLPTDRLTFGDRERQLSTIEINYSSAHVRTRESIFCTLSLPCVRHLIDMVERADMSCLRQRALLSWPHWISLLLVSCSMQAEKR